MITEWLLILLIIIEGRIIRPKNYWSDVMSMIVPSLCLMNVSLCRLVGMPDLKVEHYIPHILYSWN